MARPAYEVALRAWVREVLQRFDLPGPSPPAHTVEVTYFDQLSNPRPPLPYAAIGVLANVPDGNMPEIRTRPSGAIGSEKIRRRFSGTVSVLCMGEGHEDMAAELVHSISQHDIKAFNNANALAVRGVVAALGRLGRFRAGVVEDRTTVDFAFGHVRAPASESDVDIVDTLTTNPTFNPPC